MKKAYSLDYGIERDVDRLKAVEEILATLEKRPTSKELEQMADYLMYGRDENGKNAIQRGETTDSDKRYNSFTRLADKFESLDKILDNPLSDHSALKSLDQRYIYFRKKTIFEWCIIINKYKKIAPWRSGRSRRTLTPRQPRFESG